MRDRGRAAAAPARLVDRSRSRGRSFDRPAADGRDRQGACDRRAHSRDGRADRGARPRSRPTALLDLVRAQRRGRDDRLRLSSHARDSGDRRPRHRAQGRAHGHDRADRRGADRPARARDGRPRSRRLLSAARRRNPRARRRSSIRDGANQHLARHRPSTVRAGEIVGVAGLEGSGKNALGRAIDGDEPFESGAMEIAGKAATPRHRAPRSKPESDACRRTASAKDC